MERADFIAISVVAIVSGLVIFTWIQVNLLGPWRKRRDAKRLPLTGQWIAIEGYADPVQVVWARGSTVRLSYKGDINEPDYELDANYLEFAILPFGHAGRYKKWLAEQASGGGLSLVDSEEP